MKILFVTDRLPNPPRDGATIPIYEYMKRLSHYHDVSLLYAKDDDRQLDFIQVEDNSRLINHLWILNRYKKPKLIRIINEITMRKFYFQGWDYNLDQMKKYLQGRYFDIIWICRFTNTDVIDLLHSFLGASPIYVAAINDSATLMFRSMGKKVLLKGIKKKTKILYLIRWFRSWLDARIEFITLKKFDLILLQTEVDRNCLSKISNGVLDRKSMILPNGVKEELLKMPIRFYGREILFLAPLDGEYGDILFWIIKNVWSEIKSARNDVLFCIIGKRASKELNQIFKRDKQINYTEYIPNICEIFRKKDVMLAPTFKNYGLINKVVESMASGVPVVGDSSCFNCIPEFENGLHGIIANEGKSMAREVLDLLESPKKCIDIANSARLLIAKHFSWNDRFAEISIKLKLLHEKKKMKNI